jgi:hypothetical protein
MIRKHAPLLAVLALAACSGNPLQFGGPPAPAPPVGEPGEAAPITGVTVPAIVAQQLKTATYTPGAPTIKIDLRTLDGTGLEASYNRAAALDVAGFEAYTIQESRSQRKFLALFRRSGAVEAGVVADGGQFVNYFGGGTFARLQPFTLPAGGGSLLASYSGGYVGLLNFGNPVPGPGGAFDPAQSFRVQGEALLNADFNAQNLSVNGGVINRTIVETGAPLQDIFFEITQITANGSFSGIVKFDPTKAIGNYAGVFGGAGGTDVAGATILRPIDGDTTAREHGAFALAKCAPGDPLPCP